MDEIRGQCSLRDRDEEAVRETPGRPAVEGTCPILVGFGECLTVASVDLEVGAVGEIGGEFEACGVDYAVELVFFAVGDDAFFCYGVDADA
jgi:hypothetical protein